MLNAKAGSGLPASIAALRRTGAAVWRACCRRSMSDNVRSPIETGKCMEFTTDLCQEPEQINGCFSFVDFLSSQRRLYQFGWSRYCCERRWWWFLSSCNRGPVRFWQSTIRRLDKWVARYLFLLRPLTSNVISSKNHVDNTSQSFNGASNSTLKRNLVIDVRLLREVVIVVPYRHFNEQIMWYCKLIDRLSHPSPSCKSSIGLSKTYSSFSSQNWNSHFFISKMTLGN